MKRDPRTMHTRRSVSIHEVWLEERAGMIRYSIRTGTDGGASKVKMEGPISKKEYFKRILNGDVQQ